MKTQFKTSKHKQFTPQSLDFKQYLQQELERRCAKNPGYSLRAFAATLGISASTVSHFLNGRRKMTASTIRSLGTALNLGPQEIHDFCESSAAPDRRSKITDQRKTENFENLSLEAFSIAADWYHDAILELTHLRSFRNDKKWIAKVLGITVSEVNIAVERLKKLELLEVTSDGTWNDLSKMNTTILNDEFTSGALRKYQKAILSKSQNSIDEVPISERDHTSIMLKVSKSRIPEIKQKIKVMRRELADFIRQSRDRHDEVYLLAISLFPVSKINKVERTTNEN
jgi:uncharacterized protein (TIGR02147 family)